MKRHLAWSEPDQVCPLEASSPPLSPAPAAYVAPSAFHQHSHFLPPSAALHSLCAAVFDQQPLVTPTANTIVGLDSSLAAAAAVANTTNPFVSALNGAAGTTTTASAVHTQLNDYIRNIAALNAATSTPTPLTQQPQTPASDLSKLVAALQQQTPLTSLCDLAATTQATPASYANTALNYATQTPTCTDVAAAVAAAANLLNNRTEDGSGAQVTAADAAAAVVNAISQQALVSAAAAASVGQPSQTIAVGPQTAAQIQQNPTDAAAFLSNTAAADPSSHRRQSISAAVGQFLASAAAASAVSSSSTAAGSCVDETCPSDGANASASSGIVNPLAANSAAAALFAASSPFNVAGTTAASTSAANLSLVKKELESAENSLINPFVTPPGSNGLESLLNNGFLQPPPPSANPSAAQSSAGAFKFVGSPQSQPQLAFDSQAQLLQKAAAVVAAAQQQPGSLPALHLQQSQPVQQDGPTLAASLYSPHFHEALKMLRSPQMRPQSTGVAASTASALVNALADLQPPPSKKPIPLNGPIDLASFRWRDPQTWTSDDIVAWVLDVARRHNIAREDIGVVEFGSYSGLALTRMSEQNFQDINANFGGLLYAELRKLSNDEPIDRIDELIRYCKDNRDSDDETRPSTSRGISATNTPKPPTINAPPPTNPASNFGRFFAAASPLSPLMQGANACNAALNSLHSPLQAPHHSLQPHHEPSLQQFFVGQNHLTPHGLAGSSTVAAFAQQQKQLSDLQQQVVAQASQQQHMLHASQLMPKHSPGHLGLSAMPGTSGCNGYDMSSDFSNGGGKIRKNKDGRPRKRSQHTKGNKLWEFIRDALKDPSTCPTIVRWEDPDQGVFRIVESEKLARLWGEKKNNQKMTYEKLSRAMRTYYEKQILVPVPKTGLYPKKLVYKFGPGAHGWSAPPHLAHACLKLQQSEQ
ncbi:hypothetical protein M3Y99_01238700 [Aphelenchoides fujianensis]|nr:hypothetical protein M3Y99_01238700 [Aphelenchoides fujianensis]